MITAPSRLLLLLVIVAAAFFLGGCKMNRSLLAVRQSGDAHFERAEYVEAQADYEEYLDRSPARPEVHYMLGRTYLAQGRTAQAREQLLLAYRLRPEDDEIFPYICEGLYADKQYDDLNRLLRSRTIDRGRMQDWLLLAEYSQKQGDMDEAQRALLTAAKVDNGQSVEPQLELAKVYISAGDKSRAIERLRMAYFVAPQNGEVAMLANSLGEIVGPSFGMPPAEMPWTPVTEVPTDAR
jgi:tetratricopeptide (TPR) repeat protein